MQAAGDTTAQGSRKTINNMDMESMDLVVQYRTVLVSAVYNGEDCTDLIKQLVELDCPLEDKYAALNVTGLLKWNNQSVEYLKHIASGLATIVKFALHLIKPPEQRRNRWRKIHFNNDHVKKRVMPLRGFETVLNLLGYTEQSEGGLSFPEDHEPDKRVVVNLIVDMMLFRKEIKEYILGSHPQKEIFTPYIPQTTQDELMAFQMSGIKCDEDDQADLTSSQVSMLDPDLSSMALLQSAPPSNQLKMYSSTATTTPTTVAASINSSIKSTTTNSSGNNSSNNNSGSTINSADIARPETSQADRRMTLPISPPAFGQQEKPENLSGELAQQTEAITDLTPSTMAELNHSASSGGLCISTGSSKFACAVCGDEAVVFCRDCSNKPLCDSCNQSWHKHPQRRQHSTDSISALASLSMESSGNVHIDGAYGIIVQPSQSPARMGRKQQTEVVTSVAPANKQGINNNNNNNTQVQQPSSEWLDRAGMPQKHQYSPEQTRRPQFNEAVNDQELLDYQHRLAFQQRQLHHRQKLQQHEQQLQQQQQLHQQQLQQQQLQQQQQQMWAATGQSPTPSLYGRVSMMGAGAPDHSFSPSQHPHASHMSESFTTAPYGPGPRQPQESSTMMGSYHQQLSPPYMTGQGQAVPAYMKQQLDQQMRRSSSPWQMPPYNQEMPHSTPNPHAQISPQSQYPYNQIHPSADISPGMHSPQPYMPSSVYQQAAVHPSMQPVSAQYQPMRVASPQPAWSLNQPRQQNMPYNNQMATSSMYDTPGSHLPTHHLGGPTYPAQHLQDMWPGRPTGSAQLAQSAYYQQPTHQNELNQYMRHISSTSSLSSTNLLNDRLEHLQSIASVHDRRREFDKEIIRLKSRIDSLDSDINHKLIEDEEFCDTDEFRMLNKCKASMMKDKKVLESHMKKLNPETALQRMTEENLGPQDAGNVSPKIYYPPDISQTPLSSTLPSTSQKHPPTASDQSKMAKLSTGVDTNLSSKETKLAEGTKKETSHPGTIPVSTSQPSKQLGNSLASSQMKVHQEVACKNRVPVETSDDKVNNVAMVPLPVSPVSKHRTSATAKTSVKAWKCEHCTYDNTGNSHVCEMCHKTSDNPQLVYIPDGAGDGDEDLDYDEEQTQLVGFGQDRFIDMLNQIQSEQKQGTVAVSTRPPIMDDSDDEDEDHTPRDDQQTFVAPRILGSQEQVMLEKKKAQKAFQDGQLMNLTEGNKQLNQPSVLQPNLPPTPPKSPASSSHSSPATSTHGQVNASQWLSGGSEYSTPPSRISPTPSPPPATGRGTSSSRTSPSPRVSPSPSPSSPGPTAVVPVSESGEMGAHSHTVDNRQGGGDLKNLSLDEQIARLNHTTLVETMEKQGAHLVRLIRKADEIGFDVEAVMIAQSYCENQGTDPLDWLQKNWDRNIKKIVTMATEDGEKQQQNCVGELSVEEAKAAYISCGGNIKESAKMCVDKRMELYNYLSGLGDYPREEILQAMLQCCGNQVEAEFSLVSSSLQPFIDNIWAQKEQDQRDRQFALHIASQDLCHSFSTSIIAHRDFQNVMKDKNIDKERRIRMIFVEGSLKSWGRAELVVKILDNDLPSDDISLEDVVEAVRNCRDRQSALAFLQQECQICFTNFPMPKIRNLNICQCKMCESCLITNFEIAIREKYVRHWTCPLCSQPDLNDPNVATDYLQFLSLQLQPLIDKELEELFEVKVRDWHLQKEECFRWCAHCAEGFLAENVRGILRMVCPHCRKETCFKCKKQWEPQHDGLTCEQFEQWKIDNDPTNQSVGLAKHLDANGIDCPNCKMRFDLAKGGCMHFKCPQCAHEFCSGCSEAYHHKNMCNKYRSCKKLGLHCHCPRDCFSYLRDNSIQELQELLTKNGMEYNVNAPPDQPDAAHCPVMEQKEFGQDKKDETCGKDAAEGQAGLCEGHYKEYLVCLINRYGLDPLPIMTKENMIGLLTKCDVQVPKQASNKTDDVYRADLSKLVKDKLPLRRR